MMTQMSQQGRSSLFESILKRTTNGCEESITIQKTNYYFTVIFTRLKTSESVL